VGALIRFFSEKDENYFSRVVEIQRPDIIAPGINKIDF
jgi:hypothetical protein